MKLGIYRNRKYGRSNHGRNHQKELLPPEEIIGSDIMEAGRERAKKSMEFM